MSFDIGPWTCATIGLACLAYAVGQYLHLRAVRYLSGCVHGIVQV